MVLNGRRNQPSASPARRYEEFQEGSSQKKAREVQLIPLTCPLVTETPKKNNSFDGATNKI